MKCSCCGALTARWTGKCPSCGEWNSLVEQPRAAEKPARLPFGTDERLALADSGFREAGATAMGAGGPTVPLSSVDPREAEPRTTGLKELDRVLGGGLVPGSVTLLAGEPGVGKSTLLLQALRTRAAAGEPVLLVSAEESAQQVRLRAERLGQIPVKLFVLATTDATEVIEAVRSTGAELVVVDSVQAIALPDVSGPPGSLAQVRACAELLAWLGQAQRSAVVLVGHVTKQGTLAGPRSLEHLVDTVLTVEGDRHHALRMVRAVKHRFGPTGELGLFEMAERGLADVTDPYRMLLGDRRAGAPGTTVLPTVEGERAIVVELQALVSPVRSASPRRAARGLEAGRIGMLQAVLEQRCGMKLSRSDVFCSVAGGMRVTEPGADLPLAVAIVSAASGVAVPPDLVAFGEIGLAGEVRQVPHAQRRLMEAQRLGFRHALVPGSTPGCPAGMELIKVETLAAAVRLAPGCAQ
jgi:DNA repair protein RadA/Sms